MIGDALINPLMRPFLIKVYCAFLDLPVLATWLIGLILGKNFDQGIPFPPVLTT
jgi:hypothetical protein